MDHSCSFSLINADRLYSVFRKLGQAPALYGFTRIVSCLVSFSVCLQEDSLHITVVELFKYFSLFIEEWPVDWEKEFVWMKYIIYEDCATSHIIYLRFDLGLVSSL